ncbi:MAG: hypothetical protein Q9219_003182 [cf. Caloplaca sp. 3 TL-2023]
MGKSKAAQPTKAAEVKPLSSVKGSAITKPSQTSKAKSKDLAKQVAVKSGHGDKKSKKVVKEPTPDLSSDDDSDEDSDEAMSNASSEDSDEESDEEVGVPAVKANGLASNGVAKAAEADTSESSESSDNDANKSKPVPSTSKAADRDSDDEEEDSADSSGSSSGAESDVESEADSSEDEKADTVPGAADAATLNGKLEKVASEQNSSAKLDADSSSGSDESSEEESEDENEEDKEQTAPTKKRKAEAGPAPVAKKSKADALASSIDDANKGNLFVGNLSWNVDEEWLIREFEAHGEIKSARVMTDRESGRSRGFGYVEFVSPSDGIKAHNAMKGATIDGRTINVDFSSSRKDNRAAGGAQERSNKYGDQINEPSSTIFCANLAFGATEDDVSNAFGEHAPVNAVRIPTDINSGQPKGFAYVQFNSIEEAITAFEGMKGSSINGRSIRIDYATQKPQNDGGGRGGGRGRGRGGFERGGRGGGGGGRGRGGFDRGGRGGGRGGSTNRGGFGDFKGKKMTF